VGGEERGWGRAKGDNERGDLGGMGQGIPRGGGGVKQCSFLGEKLLTGVCVLSLFLVQ